MRHNSILKRIILPAVIVAAGFLSMAPLSTYIAGERPSLPEEYADSDLTFNGARLKGFAFGMEGLMADWYYVRSLQYVGDKVVNSKSDFINIEDLKNLNPTLLYPLLTNSVGLDPHFVAPYSYGALVMPAIDKEKAIELATKGIENNPSEWRLYQYLGYIYWRLNRYEEASEIYEKGSEIADAPPFMKIMAASMKTAGGSRETSRAIYREMLGNTADEQARVVAERKLDELTSMDERDAMNKALLEWKEKTGRCADSLHEILPILARVKFPEDHDFRVNDKNDLLDPTEAPYLLDKQTCEAKLDLTKTAIAY
jgi:tetratricopeptide (TPR) repeat protein